VSENKIFCTFNLYTPVVVARATKFDRMTYHEQMKNFSVDTALHQGVGTKEPTFLKCPKNHLT